MKLPTFWPDTAEVWFAQADAKLMIQSVTLSKTKFYHAVAVLLKEVTTQILDLIRAPPARDPYSVLHERLITLYTLNDYKQFKALVSLPLSGDWKPSDLMNRMHALFLMIKNPTSSSGGCFSDTSPLMSVLKFSTRWY